MQRFFPEIFWQMALDSSLNLIIAALTGALMIGLGARAIHTISSFKWSRTIARSGFKPVLIVVLCLSLIVGIIVGVIVWDARDDVIQYYQLTSVLFVVVLVLIVPLGTAISFIYFAAYIVPIFLLYSQEGLSVDLRESHDHEIKKWRRNLVYAVLLIGAGTTVIILLHTLGVEYAIDSLDRLAAGEKPLSPSQISLTREVLVSLALYALPLGLSFGVAAGLTLGGRMLIKHYTTRAVLWLWGLLPWHVIRFLDQTTALILTKKSLGGYTFYHPIVHEYFTENYKSERASETNTEPFIHTTRQP
jgi:hypothetical protein